MGGFQPYYPAVISTTTTTTTTRMLLFIYHILSMMLLKVHHGNFQVLYLICALEKSVRNTPCKLIFCSTN